MSSRKINIERNKLDYLLTDIMPVEVSELFSFGKFYEFLFQRQKEVDKMIKEMKQLKAKNSQVPFTGCWGNWASTPLKYNILKGVNGTRELNLVQPIAALNMYLFVECYQKEILDLLEENSCFSLRYHRKNNDLFYIKKTKKVSNYFVKTSKKMDRAVLQQTGAYFKIHKFNSVSSFTNSRLWQQCNFQYRYFAKVDYKACFNSIYTHTYKWIIEKNTVDSKAAENSNLYIVIDRVLQNINGCSSNGLIIGPEFSRMIAEILLQHIDVEVKKKLVGKGIHSGKDYRIFRYVDDIYVFSNSPETVDLIIKEIEKQAQVYLLNLNELKCFKSTTPVVISDWLGKTRQLADKIADLFYKRSEVRNREEDQFLLKNGYISLDRLKDEFIFLMNEFPKEQRYIVSFILSTLLNNISGKKDGFRIFEEKKWSRAYVLLDLAMYVYSFCPCFEHTQKMISMIVYMNDEVQFKTDEENHHKLQNLIRRYDFIFEKGNLNDLCNWFLFFYEFKISLLQSTERVLEEALREENNPILWANYLIYSRYYMPYHEDVLREIEQIIMNQMEHMGTKEILLHREFWYVLVFHNCPYLNAAVKSKLEDIIGQMMIANPQTPADKMNHLVCEFMMTGTQNHFFYWGYYHFDASKQLTFRTYQRTLFKQYKKKRSIELYGSLDT